MKKFAIYSIFLSGLFTLPGLLSGLTAPEAILLNPLWDNGTIFTNEGVGAGGADISRKQAGSTIFGYETSNTGLFGAYRLADDFVVPSGGWTVAGVFLFAYQVDHSPPSFSGDIRIWDNEPGIFGANMIYEGDPFTNAWFDFTNIYRTPNLDDSNTERPIMRVFVPLDQHLKLDEGTYWLDWQLTGANGTEQVFTPPTSLADSNVGNPPVQFRPDPSNSIDEDDFNWYPISLDGCCDDPFVNLPFQILPVPEPLTYALFGVVFLLGLAGFRHWSLRRKKD